MKTAEEMLEGFMAMSGCQSIEPLRNTEEFKASLAYFKTIQLDAWKQGMTDAAKVVWPHNKIIHASHLAGLEEELWQNDFKAIIEARDNKTTL